MTSDQRKSVIYGAIGVCVFGAIFYGLLVWLDGWPGPLPDPGERIGLALKLSVLPVSFLIAVILTVSVSRFIFRANDPLNDPDPPRWRAVDQRVLSNTVEQTIAFLPLYFGSAMVIGPDESAYLTALPVTFVAARLAFWVGYRTCVICRAPGMAAGFAINLGMLVLVVAGLFG